MNTLPTRLAKMAGSRMKSWFPTTSYPLIVGAPMATVTNPKLAAEVTKAGGLGFLQGGRDFAPESPVLKELDDQLSQVREHLGLGAAKSSQGSDSNNTLPIGVGFITYAASTKHFGSTAVPILRRYRPAAVWLFAPSPDAPDTIRDTIASLKSDVWTPKVVVQVGTVAAARDAARHGADIIVAQGVDAGGHHCVHGAGVVCLVPEISDVLREEFPEKEIAVWAAGGIADGRGVAAALALGAEGVVLGTRYMVSPESDAGDFKRKALLSTSDGGTNTVKSHLHDRIQNSTWPDFYEGRAIVTPTYEDHAAGVPLDENTRRYKTAMEAGDISRMVIWS
ncbi:FMN-dependent 2-nitropropane dioxygenase [Hypoxylon sp. FL1150]|nr:FMN-dependent 2-nitropropane dioxygenase [Hypoxylon sp. FL1150]